jgi:excisionase family DNA binding protein
MKITETQPQPKLITIADVSKITSLKRSYIYHLINTEQLKRIKLGRKTVFLESQVLDWVSQQVKRGS